MRPDQRRAFNSGPPCLSTFKRGGWGGPESGVHLSNGSDQHAQINGDEDHSGPPPPAFLPLSRGGGSRIPYAYFRRPRSRRSDQRRLCSPALLNCPVLSQCGPSSYNFILTSAFPLLPCVIHSPLLFGPHGLTFFSPPTRSLPRVPFLHMSTSRPKASLLHPIFLPPRASPTPSLLSYTMSSMLTSMPIPQAIQLFQVAAREVFPIPRS
jgi:hypothetical protein